MFSAVPSTRPTCLSSAHPFKLMITEDTSLLIAHTRLGIRLKSHIFCMIPSIVVEIEVTVLTMRECFW
jgi:hypothetical protein